MMFGALVWSLRGPQGPAPAAVTVLATGALVLGSAVAMTVLAVGLGGLAADLSDEQRGALGPGTVYLFLLLGGLLNVIFGAAGWEGVRIGALYLAMVAAVWHSGVEQARGCLDPDARRQAPLRLADAAILLLLFALVPVALDRGLRRIAAAPDAIATAHVGVIALFGVAAARLLRGRGAAAEAVTTRSPVVAILGGLLFGVATRGARLLVLGAGPPLADALRQPPVLALLLALALSEELVLRGVVQLTVERELRPQSGRAAPWIAVAVGVALAQLAAPEVTGLSVLLALGPAMARAATGRLLGAFAARVMILLAGS